MIFTSEKFDYSIRQLFLIVISLIVLLLLTAPTQVFAQYCAGGATCCVGDWIVDYGPAGCKISCGPYDFGCVKCSVTGAHCDNTRQVSCDFKNQSSCSATCPSDYVSGSCRVVWPPPPPPPQDFCGSGPACTSSQTCCPDGSCRSICPDPPPPPLCTGCQDGYTCCTDGSCVPPNNPCGVGTDPCLRDATNATSTLWVRVFSEEGGQAIYWKGSQANDTVKTDQGWSGSGIDAGGSFSTYKVNQSSALKNFDKNINRISPEMDVKLIMKSDVGAIIGGSPGDDYYNYLTASWQVMSSGCKAGPVTLTYTTFPAGTDDHWSHQYCAGGQPEALDSNGAPAITENQMYCLNSSLNCNSDSKAEKGCTIYCDPPALDGCAGKFTVSRPEGSPGETRRDYGSLGTLSKIIGFNGGRYKSADLKYDGAWTMSQIIYNKKEGARNFYYELAIKPPTGYTCGIAAKLYSKTYNDGHTEERSASISPGLIGGWCIYNIGTDTAIIMPELVKQTINTCQVMLDKNNLSNEDSAVTINVNPKGGADQLTVSSYGVSNDDRLSNAGLTRLWIADKSWQPFSLGNSSDDLVDYYTNAKFAYYDPTKTGQLQAYRYLPSCISTNGILCNPIMEARLNTPKNTGDIHYTLPEGYYVAHCDVPNAPANDATVTDGRCTGAPYCSFNHAKLNKICSFLGIPNCSSLMESYTCAGWRECDTTPTAINEPSDIAVIKAECVPYCDVTGTTCELASNDDGCGGSCDASSFCIDGANENEACTADTPADDQCPGILNGCQPFTSIVGTPGLVGTMAVDTNDMCLRDFFRVTWTPPAGGFANLSYDVLIYKTTAFSTAINALASAVPGGSGTGTSIIYTGVTSPYTVPVEDLADMGPDITIAVRASNPYCGGSEGNWNSITSKLVCAQDPYITVELLKDEGGVDNNNGRCSGPAAGTTAIDKSYTSTISLNGAPYGLTTPVTSGSPTITLTNGVGRFLNLRYLPANSDGVALPFKVTLNRTPIQLAAENLVQTCPMPTAGNAFQSLSAPEADNVVTAGTKGKVRFYFKQGFSPWWRTIGGLIGADGGAVTSLIPDSCATHATCIDFLSASLTLPVSKSQSDRRAGLSIASGAITAGSGGRTQHALSQELHATGMTPNAQSPSTDYAFFSDKIARSGAGTANILPATLLASGPTSGAATVIDGKTYYVWNLTGDQTITIDPAKWNLTDKNVVILVNGSITFDTTSPTLPLIATNANSFLLVVAKDNITFSERIGRSMSDSVAVNDASPVVSGVFVAGQNLIIADGGNTTPDLQFVGKGVFAGLNGVQLLREFDDGGDGRLLNNLQPAELFIHDPQMVLNTPDFLETPIIQYQEIQ